MRVEIGCSVSCRGLWVITPLPLHFIDRLMVSIWENQGDSKIATPSINPACEKMFSVLNTNSFILILNVLVKYSGQLTMGFKGELLPSPFKINSLHIYSYNNVALKNIFIFFIKLYVRDERFDRLIPNSFNFFPQLYDYFKNCC